MLVFCYDSLEMFVFNVHREYHYIIMLACAVVHVVTLMASGEPLL